MNLSAEVEVALAGVVTIPKTDYERWIRGDLRTRARVYALAASHWSRIHPEASGAEHCRFMADYLLECLLQNPESDDFLHSGFDAAHSIAAWPNISSRLQKEQRCSPRWLAVWPSHTRRLTRRLAIGSRPARSNTRWSREPSGHFSIHGAPVESFEMRTNMRLPGALRIRSRPVDAFGRRWRV
jgi:hypothetical protein